MPLTLDELKLITDTQDFGKLVREVENEFFDAKGQIYRLDEGDYAKRELAKDVSAFANAGGGYIFIGAKTRASTVAFGDEVTEIVPLSRELVDPERYLKVVEEWLHPQPEGLKVEWYPFGDDGKGLGVINVPPQAEQAKPFLITKTIEGRKTTEALIGYAKRTRDSTKKLSVVELHHALRLGLNFEAEIIRRLENIESTIENQVVSVAHSRMVEQTSAHIAQRVTTALAHEEMGDERALVLVAYPPVSAELRTIFSSSEGSILRAIEKPPDLRYSGWDLGTLDHAKIVRGERIRVVNGNRKVIDLYRDGCLVFAGLANREFLAWGRDCDGRLNPLALIELVVNFTRFYELVLKDFVERPAEIILRVELRNLHLNGEKSVLGRYSVNSDDFMQGRGSREAPDSVYQREHRESTSRYDADRLAYQLIREIYLWFGHEEDVIPYVGEVDGERKIAVSLIVKR